MTRRAFGSFLGGALIARPQGVLFDTHIHLFDPKHFPYHSNGTYQAEPATLDDYAAFVRDVRLDGTVIVHPEPYQDDHRYLEYCFANEPREGFFKGTLLLDPLKPDTPARLRELTKRMAGRIVALRIHQNRKAGDAPWDASRPIRERDMSHASMRATWRAATDLGLAIQMHFTPWHADSIANLAQEFRSTTVILDHLGRAGMGTPAEYERVLALAKFPKTVMKFSGWAYSTKQPHPHRDLTPLVKRTVDAFGADRMIWGGLGHNRAQFDKAVEVFETAFAFASETERAKVRGVTAKKLFGFA